MKFAFFGTDQFSVDVLETLKTKGLLPSLVVTIPDKPQGRRLVITPPPVKIWASNNALPVIQPQTLKDFALPDQLDLAVVASYGKILPANLLKQPTHGFINVHPSLLPKYRGATPLESTILAGDQETGVTIMQVDEKMDHGTILAQKKVPLDGLWLEELAKKLAIVGGKMLSEVMPKYLKGEVVPQEQDHENATYTQKITKEDGLIDLNDDPVLNYRKIRAYTPWPGAYFFHHNKRTIIKKASLVNNNLIIERVVQEGKKETNYKNISE